MTPFSERKLIEQITIVIGLVTAFVKSYATWKVGSRYHSLLDLLFSLSMVTLIIAGILTALFLLIHQLERKWKTQLTKKGHTHPWQIRSAPDCGITLLPLFPMALLLGLINFWSDISHIYLVVSVLSVGLLFTSIAFLWKTGEAFNNSVNSLVTVAAISSVKVGLVLWHLRLLGLAGSCFVAFGSQLLFLLLLRMLLSRCPKSFSIGEALIVAQAMTSVLLASCLWCLAKVFEVCGSMKPCYLGEISTQLTYSLALGVTSLLAMALLIKSLNKPLQFYTVCAVLGGFYLYPAWYVILKEEPVLWLFRHTLGHSIGRCLLVVHWLGCTVLAVAVVCWANVSGISITTTVRKFFHAAVILIYLPGLAWDVDLLFFATSVASALFLGVECVRVLKVPPFGKAIDIALQPFLDEKDSGNLILTHIYLLIGCSISIWLFPLSLTNHGVHISMASGILTLGFGDTAASVGGIHCGKHRWPDSKKTFEGTLCAFAIQSASSIILYMFLATPADTIMQIVNYLYIILVSALCSLLEGVTTQIDNLFLPVYVYIMLVAV